MILKKYAIQAVSRIARANNYQVIPNWDIPNYPIVQHLKEVFSTYRIDCVLDVGANVGQYRDLLRDKVGFEGQILSFEPVSHIARRLIERTKEDSKWSVFPIALGSVRGEAQINVTKASSRNSLLPPRTDVVDQFWEDDAVIRSETVTVETLDSFLASSRIDCSTRRLYLKTDTQGFDLEVLKGAAGVLRKLRAVQFEASIRPIYHGMPSYRDAIAFMNDAGYEISGLFKITSDEKLRLIEFDCVMINDQKAD